MQPLFQELRRLATLAAKSHNSAATISSPNMPPPAAIRKESRWIMLCLDHKYPPLMTLHQIQLSSKPSNTQLFQCLSKEYERKREPYAFLTISIRPFW
jgi:hypothetical protein